MGRTGEGTAPQPGTGVGVGREGKENHGDKASPGDQEPPLYAGGAVVPAASPAAGPDRVALVVTSSTDLPVFLAWHSFGKACLLVWAPL